MRAPAASAPAAAAGQFDEVGPGAPMVGRRDLAWAYGAQVFNVGSGLMLLPFALRYLGAEDMGVWYLFIAFAALGQLLELGFQPTIARQAAYVYGGASSLHPDGLPEMGRRAISEPLLADLYAAGRRVYALLATAAAVLLVVGGGLYLAWLPSTRGNVTHTLVAWTVYAVGAAVTFGGGVHAGFLQGRGEVAAASRSLALGKAFMVAVSVPALALGYGLLGLAVSSLAGALLYRWLLHRLFLAPDRSETALLRGKTPRDSHCIGVLWKSAWRLGAVQIGAFLILRANLILASAYFALGEVAAYGLALQVAGLLGTVAAMLATLLMPRMSTLQAQGRMDELRRLFSTAIVGAALLYATGAALLLLLGPAALHGLGSRTTLPPQPLLALLLGVLFLELLHSVSATYLTTLNRVPFTSAALLSGVAVVTLAYALVRLTDLGLAALVAAQGLVQLAYNNWKWPLEAMRHLGMRPSEVLRLGASGLLSMTRSR